MAVKTAYISKLGRDYKVSAHFTLREIASKDGADKVLYSEELLAKLEEARAYGGFTVSVNSFYRSPAHNRRVGGASNSSHTRGLAADVVFKKDGRTVNAELICCLCQSLGFDGVAYISPSSVHLDMADRTYRGDERKGYSNNVNDFFECFNITKEDVEALRVVSKTEEEEMIYKDINEVPEWGREAVQLRLDHGWSDCKDIEHSLLRSWVTLDKENPYIGDMEDVKKHAEWAIPEVQRLFDMGKLKGTGAEPIAMRLNELRVCIINNR